MTPPPIHRPKRKSFDFFAADPFDPRFRDEQQNLTPLGEIVQIYYETRRYLKCNCPDAIAFLDEHGD